MDESNDEARLGLDLGLGLNDCKPRKREKTAHYDKRTLCLDFSIPLHTSGRNRESSSSLKVDVMKGELCENSNNESKGWMENFGCRKKLRLSRDQTTLLEDSFKQHPTLNTAQKQALAEKLNLKPRQVEVWFQNRRARTKLKQTEADCEFLRRNCERLSEENWRLKKELFELRSSLKVENIPPSPPPPPPPPPARIFHHKGRAAHGKNRGGSEEKEAAMEVVHGNENLIDDTAKKQRLE